MADVSKDPGGLPAGRPLLRPFSGHGGAEQGPLRPLGARRIAVSPHTRSETPTESGTPTPTVVPASFVVEGSESGVSTGSVESSVAAAATASAVATSEPPHAVASVVAPSNSRDALPDGSAPPAAPLEAAGPSALDVQSLHARNVPVELDDQEWNGESVAYGSTKVTTPSDDLAIEGASAAPIASFQPQDEARAASDVQAEAPSVGDVTEAPSQPRAIAVDAGDLPIVASIDDGSVDKALALDARGDLAADDVPGLSSSPTFDAQGAIEGASHVARGADPDALDGTSPVTELESHYASPEMVKLVAGSEPGAATAEEIALNGTGAPIDGSARSPCDLVTRHSASATADQPVDEPATVDAVALPATLEGRVAELDASTRDDVRQPANAANAAPADTGEIGEFARAVRAETVTALVVHRRPGESITPPPPIPGIDLLGASEEEVAGGGGAPESVPAMVTTGEGSSAPESRGDLAADGTALAVALGGETTAWSEGSAGSRGASDGSPGLVQGDAALQDLVARSEAQAHVLATLDIVARRVRGGEIVPTVTVGCSAEAVLASVLASLLSPRT